MQQQLTRFAGSSSAASLQQLSQRRAAAPSRASLARRITISLAAPAAAPVAPVTNNGKTKPSPAETARTVASICTEGTLSTIGADGTPIGTPVNWTLDKNGNAFVQLGQLEMKNLSSNAKCSVSLQPISHPARAVASVTVLGTVDLSASTPEGYSLNIEKCLYLGGLDEAGQAQEVSGSDFQSAEPDVLRREAHALVKSWNEDRAEDIYRIVAHFLGVPATDMAYAELLWVDQLGMYIKAEMPGEGAKVVRVPFYRPILDERDARSVITMASQIAWEVERPYTPPLPAIFAEAAEAAQN